MHIIPEPPKEIFEINETQVEQIMSESKTTYLLDKIDFTDGIKVYVNGVERPKKGFPTPQAVWGINQCKRPLIEFIKLVARPMFLISGIYFLLISKKNKIKFLTEALSAYNRLTFDQVRPFILKKQFKTPFAQETETFVYEFMTNLGIEDSVSKQFSVIISHIFEYDDAYRFRMQDLISEVSKKDLLDRPILEISRLVKLLEEREMDPSVFRKFNKMSVVVKLLLMIPSVREAFRVSIFKSDISKLQYDEDDRYWVSVRNDYKFFGETFEERSSKIIMPVGYKIQD